MRGFAMLEKGKTGIIEKPDPVIKNPTDAIIKVTAVAPCTSDVHLVESGAFKSMYGNFIGHESVGVVQEVGSAVKGFKPGDRVAVPDISPFWDSMEAQDGMPNFSPGSGRTTNPDLQGMFAEYIHFERADSGLAHIPDNVTDAQAVMAVDMIPTPATAIPFLDIKLGETVVVIGIGPVGLMGVGLVVLNGAGRIFGVGSRPACFEVARKMGATDLINYKEGSIKDQILAKNGGPVDKVLVCGGDSDVLMEAFGMCKRGGHIASVAMFSTPTAQIPAFGNSDKEYRAFQIYNGRLFIERLLNLIAYERIHPEYAVSHVMHGLDSIPEAFQMMTVKKPDMIKPVVIL
jgi:threonine dehydrogenase-like Zn-dependent dehydrogenase